MRIVGIIGAYINRWTNAGKLNVSVFTVGEEINPPSYFIRLRVTAVHHENNTLEAVVIKAEGAYAETFNYKGAPQDGFKVGMELIFQPRRPGCWVAEDKSKTALNLPWFELLVNPDDGKKSFEHYR